MNSTTSFAFQTQGMRLFSTHLTWVKSAAYLGISPSLLLYSRRHQHAPPLAVCSHFAELDFASSKSLAPGTVHSQLLNTHFKFTFLHLLICLNSVGQTDWQHEHGLHSAPAPHTNCSMSVQGVCWITLFICGSNGITTSLLINIHMLSDNTADLPIAKSKDTFPIQSPEDSRHSASCFGKGSLLHPSSMAGLIYSQLKAFTAPRTILE